jgi:hypothetical protein
MTGASALGAINLAAYEFGSSTTPSLISSDSDALSVAGGFASGAGLGATAVEGGSSGRIAAADININAETGGSSTSVADRLAYSNSIGDYFSFTVTPVAGHELDLSTLTFQYAERNLNSTNGYNMSVQLRSSIDGFASPLQVIYNSASTTATFGTSGSNSLRNAVADLSGYANIAGPVTFRLVVADDAILQYSQSGSDIITGAAIDNVVLTGDSVPIPEPTATALLAIASIVIGRRRRAAS